DDIRAIQLFTCAFATVISDGREIKIVSQAENDDFVDGE
ncbi:30S ribosomal protein S2, partial [Pseudoalteromonas phenolica]